MSSNVRLEQYGSGTNAHVVRIGSLELYFSYQTAVAYRHKGQLVVRKNDWNATTGRHLKYIDGGNEEARVDGSRFEEMLNAVLKEYGLL